MFRAAFLSLRARTVKWEVEDLHCQISNMLMQEPDVYNIAKMKKRAVVNVDNMLRTLLSALPPAEQKQHLSAIVERLTKLSGVVFQHVNPAVRDAADFDRELDRISLRMHNGASVHLELGTWKEWPDERVQEAVSTQGLGRFIRLDLSPEFRPDVVANVTALPFANNSIDRVHSSSLLEHVAYPHDTISEAYRVLRPGGALVTVAPFHFVEHNCPKDYLRYTGQFFDEVCKVVGFSSVLSDTRSASGTYYTLHQLSKAAVADTSNSIAGTVHLAMMSMLAMLSPFDDLMHGGGGSHFHSTRSIALK